VHGVYVGANYSTFSNYVVGADESEGSLDSIDTILGRLLCNTGLVDRVDIEVSIPVANVSQGEKSNTGLGNVDAAIKYRLLNESDGRPVSLSVYAGAGTGAAHRDSRGDMHNLGEGTTDVFAGLGVGRLGIWSQGQWWARFNIQYRYRLALQTVDGQKIPADDIVDSFDAGLQVHPLFGLAVSAHGFYRLGGYDIGEWPSDLDSDNKWAALDAGSLLAGGKLLVYATDFNTISLSMLRTVWAKNNPTDTLVVSAGATIYFAP
jgi:hypothetical protein